MTNTTNNSVELLDSVKHRNIKVDPAKLNTRLHNVNVTTLVAGELSTLVHEYAVFLTQSPSTKEYQLTAVLGFKSGENLYLNGDNWQATYLPLDIMRRPFQAFMPDNNNLDKAHIAIDLLSEQVNEKHGTPLYDEQGNKTEFLKRIEQTFSELMGGTMQTIQLLKLADELNLIESINLNLDIPNRGKVELNGLFAFNKENIDKLSGEALEKAHKSGLLQVIHLVLSSTINLQKLIRWAASS
ncbi:SapC family protein [Paraglaciecola sp.]|uniref:SapC family protein n=1 Tax=Paraglaciecola sp. TaxID=1920173 RepID=UPI003EF2BF2A